MTGETSRRQLSSAEERRDTVLRTALGAFAAKGYRGTTTADVAKSAGISQGYVYRLFTDKETLFLRVVEHCFARIRESLADGAARAASDSPEAVLDAMGEAYARLIGEEDTLLLVQMHAQAAAVSEPSAREAVQHGYARMVEYVRQVSGGNDDQVRDFFAKGALCHLLVAVDADALDAPWSRTLAAGIRHY
ncbi:TetR/AcrR family transcriptional regulator [Saccharothrix syringae]|uniref:TetR/AcrR family transcriptional regulator n=1 Tax=Saccharothrix syringae TaxID=103733 RepID=A0A5Q0GYL1_SACSY|nr:TetR/AcrR family transcriptional regulator [Saccharothrix syringae]QFZ18594.1 TetR/AcrR family transcriptional regulator [Saccharothrix syringae]